MPKAPDCLPCGRSGSGQPRLEISRNVDTGKAMQIYVECVCSYSMEWPHEEGEPWRCSNCRCTLTWAELALIILDYQNMLGAFTRKFGAIDYRV